MAIHDWKETSCTSWDTKHVMVQDGKVAVITRARTHTWDRVLGVKNEAGEIVEVPETEDREEPLVVRHYRTSFPDDEGKQVPQTDEEWHANIKREIAADLGDLNKVEPEEQNITAKVA